MMFPLAEEQILTLNNLDVTPCPFCGDTHISVVQKYTSGKYNLSHGFSIGCQTVNCIGCHTYGRLYETKEEAIKAWNKRATEQEAVEPRVSAAEQRCGHCNKVIEMDGWQSCPWCGKRIGWKGWWKKNGTRNQDS